MDSTHPATLATNNSFTAAGAVAQMTYGNGLVETASFNSRLQPTEMRAYNPSNGVDTLKLVYGFNAGTANNGNVASMTASGAQAWTRTYTYDELNRIKSMSATGVACTGLSWSYDIWANRTAQSTTGGSCGNSSLAFDQNNRITGSGYEYDAAGNVTVNPAVGMSHQWDAEGRMKSMGGTSAVYTYDADGRRVVKTVGGASTYYYYDIAGKVSIEKNQSNVWAVGYIYLNGQMVATYKDGTTYFAHKDHLGSTRVLTKLDKSVQDNMDYLPYGEQVSGGSSTSHKFTGHERDGESGLDYMGARYYSVAGGRFLSIDPIMESVVHWNPQTWNRYAYVLNNPLAFIDPNGELWIATGSYDDPYSWVDQCPSGQTCYETVSANVYGDVVVYGSTSANDVRWYFANAAGVVDVEEISKHPDAQYVSIQTPGLEENYLGPEQAAALFNVAAQYHQKYPNDLEIVFTGGSASDGGPGVDKNGRPLHQTHNNGENIDMRYIGPNGRSLRGDQAAANGDVDRNRLIIALFKAQKAGLGSVLTGDPARYGTQPASAKNRFVHRNHMHFKRR